MDRKINPATKRIIELAEQDSRQWDALHERQQDEFEVMRDRSDYYPAGSYNHKTLGRLRYSVSLTDLSLGMYIGDAKQKAQTAYIGGFRHWVHHYTNGIADVTINLLGRTVLIRIVPIDSFYCEFATTGTPVVTGVVDQDGTGFETFKGLVIGVDVSILHGTTKVAARVRSNKRSITTGYDESKIHRQYQTDMLQEPVVYPQGVKAFNRWFYGRALYESWAPGNPHTHIPIRGSLRGTNLDVAEIGPLPGPDQQFTQSDVGIDVTFEDQHGTNPLRSAYIRGAADWPRASGLQLVDDPTWGKREFAIMVDAFNVFNIFPTSAIDPLDTTNPYNQNVDDSLVRRVAPTIPGWVEILGSKLKDYFSSSNPPSTEILDEMVDGAELDWKFNHLGTKAATVAYERSAYDFDATFWSTTPSGTPFTLTDFNTDVIPFMGVQSRTNTEFNPGYNEQRYFTATGILEATVTITLTGSDVNDYTATVTIAEIQRPTSDLPCPLLVGYVWYDIFNADRKTKLALAGDFMSLDVEQWADGITQFGKTSVLVLRNINTTAEVKTWRGMPVVAADFTTLSFVFMPQELLQDVKQTFPKRPGAPGPATVTVDMFHHSFGMWIVSQGIGREFLFPDSLPQDKRDLLISIATAQTGREYIADLLFDNPSWVRIPVYQPRDGWGDTDIVNVREHYAGLWGFRTPVATGPNYTITEFTMFSLWRPRLGEPGHLLYCDNPRWGWHCYECAIADHMKMNAQDVFYTHPNGTYAFFSNAYIYNPQGVCNQLGFNWYADTLSSFDVSLLEHCIFDRIHFELRAADRSIGHKDTSFVTLYNNAVTAGLNSKKLEAGIELLSSDKLRATFEFGQYEFDPVTYPGWFILNFSTTWDDQTYYFIETAVHGGTYYNTVLGQQGPIVGLSFAQPWGLGTGYGAGNTPYGNNVSSHLHVKFTGLSISVPEQATT